MVVVLRILLLPSSSTGLCQPPLKSRPTDRPCPWNPSPSWRPDDLPFLLMSSLSRCRCSWPSAIASICSSQGRKGKRASSARNQKHLADPVRHAEQLLRFFLPPIHPHRPLFGRMAVGIASERTQGVDTRLLLQLPENQAGAPPQPQLCQRIIGVDVVADIQDVIPRDPKGRLDLQRRVSSVWGAGRPESMSRGLGP